MPRVPGSHLPISSPGATADPCLPIPAVPVNATKMYRTPYWKFELASGPGYRTLSLLIRYSDVRFEPCPPARGTFRGRGAPRGGSASRGGAPPGSADKPRREAILDLSKYQDERIRVKFTGGRQVTGVLKGYDQLLNLVLDDVQEERQEPTPHTRALGLAVLRGPTITILSPVDGSEEIENPFAQQG
ncbi:U6 snRNA-associated-like-Sm protein LSm7 [Rhizoctonia solani]|uniref:U6 snRNA-associated-like-Sm protein LSm7 n=1 Tax=Rhizoctonia solani TaxID=456999 RepID=A0A8H8SSQ2_9AGAM|nr:U6 snRNA-associated-like-Sm protein LSm7 [Rhizoctonia solani]QRW17021.1 U6 snRNA-associated-like-Sm protein LSm7 [Rhizoctonia solani]